MGVIILESYAKEQDQQRSQETAATQEQQQQPNETQSNETQSDMKSQDAKSFTGRVAKEKGKLVLKDPVTKMSYQLDDQDKAASYVGKQVKVTGKLDMNN